MMAQPCPDCMDTWDHCGMLDNWKTKAGKGYGYASSRSGRESAK